MDITVHRAQLVREADTDIWHLTCEVTHDDGTVEPVGWSVPVEAVMWKMGEYDLDPTDIDGALELILFGFYVPRDQPTEILTADDLPAARRKWRQTVKARRGKGKLRGVKLAAQRMAPVTEVVTGTVTAESGPAEDPLDMIRARTVVTAEHVAVIRDDTDRRRQVIREQRDARQAAAGARATETAEQLRARLTPTTVDPGAPTIRAMPDQQTAAIVERMLDKRKARIREQRAAEGKAQRHAEREEATAATDAELGAQQAEQAGRVAARREQRKRDAAAEKARRQAAAAELAAVQQRGTGGPDQT